MEIRVRDEPFDAGAELNRFSEGHRQVGGIVSFSGLVRDDGGLEHMEIEHYPDMSVKAIMAVAERAVERWNLYDILIIHRFGKLTPGEQIMMVATAAGHRAAAFEAADFLMDYLKSRAPFWKKEVRAEGEAWVAAKDGDEAALDRW